MPRTVAPLTDTKIRQTSPGSKPIRLSDGGGLFLLVEPGGSKGWRFAYNVRGRRRLISFGTYPTVSLAKAREKRSAARAAVADGRDPSLERKAAKLAARPETFEEVAREWLVQQKPTLAAATYGKAEWMLLTLAAPWLRAPLRK